MSKDFLIHIFIMSMRENLWETAGQCKRCSDQLARYRDEYVAVVACVIAHCSQPQQNLFTFWKNSSAFSCLCIHIN